jgi:pimeloyl-ACP methyl ester carboxylesterase
LRPAAVAGMFAPMLDIASETSRGPFPFPPRGQDRWPRIHPHAVTCEVEEAGHFRHGDAPERVIGALEWFLATTP